MNCKKHIPSKCKADCCGVVPIPENIWKENSYKANHERICGIDNTTFPLQVVPVTVDLVCSFLSEEYTCKIYDSRPQCCRRFGEEENLKCPFEKP